MNIPSYSETQNQNYYNDELSQALVGGLGDGGFTITQQTTESIMAVAETAPSGTMLFDTDTNEMKVIINGEIKTFTVT